MNEVKQQVSMPQVPKIPAKSHGSKILLFILGAVTILIGIGEYVLWANKTQAPIANNVLPQPSPTPIDETVDWKTYRNEKYAYELKYPSYFNIFGIKEYDGYTQFTDGAIDLTVNNYSTGVDQRILNTEEIKIGGENAKKYNHILEEFPDQVGFTIVQFSHNNKEFTIILQSRRDQKPLSGDQIKTFNKILSTFKFTNPEEQEIIESVSKDLVSSDTPGFQIEVKKVLGNYAYGVAGVPPQGFVWYAVKQSNQWKKIWDGQNSPSCAIMNNYNVPKEIYKDCSNNY